MDMYEGGLFVQVDVSHRVLRTETVRNFLAQLAKKGGDLKSEAEKALLGESFKLTCRKVEVRVFSFQGPAC